MSAVAALREFIVSTWSDGIRARAAQNVWEFARDNIVFTPKMGNITGPYDPDLTPYTKLFQEAITSDFRNIPEEDWWLRALAEKGQRCDEAFVVKSSQSGLTQGALNGTIYLPLHAPGRLLYVLDSVPKAKKVALTRVIPFLRELCGAVIADEADLNATFIELMDMIIEFGGSYSSGLFSEKPLKYAFADDVEYMVSQGGAAGMLDGVHVIDHLRSRFTTADESFLGVFSKPNLESSEFIANALAGSQHRYYVRCPHCGTRQVLEPENLNFDHKGCKDLAGRYDLDAVEALTTYRCASPEHCEIEEKWKHSMNLAGTWLPKSSEARVRDEDPALVPRRLSMQISDLYSPFPKVKWGMLARMKIAAENNPAALKHLTTNHFARPWRESAISLRADNVRAICAGALNPLTGKWWSDDCDHEGKLKVPAYRRGECPFRPVAVTATSDVQGDKFKWIICGWQIDGTCALIEYGACLGTFDLYEKMIDPRAHDGSPLLSLLDPDRPLIAEHGLVDSGAFTSAIYDFCIRTGWAWYPSKGTGGIELNGQMVAGRPDFYEGTPILRYHYHDHALKTLLYNGKIAKAHDSKWPQPRLYLPHDLTDDFILELLSESLQPKRTSGRAVRMEWIHNSRIGPNDWGDALKMQFALWQIVGPQYQGAAGINVRHYELKPPPLLTPAATS